MSEINLLPCPFCGGEAIVYEDEEYNAYMIGCKNCCSVDPMTEWADKHNAIEQWNNRKPIDDIVKRLKEDIAENPEASLGEYRAGLYKAIEIVKEEGGLND